ncbi:MAG: TfoX/Sxy family protein [Anaerolineales bacterium]|nr:TfoX/Sxy family protein [Anaerolineales bacterium]
MEDLTQLPNIGPVLAEKLKQIGVTTYDDLAEMGSVDALIRIGQTDITAFANMLYALEGAILGVRWHNIPKEHREKVKNEFYQAISRQPK